jgi:hypothetical protein
MTPTLLMVRRASLVGADVVDGLNGLMIDD